MTDMLIESQTLEDRLRRALPTDVDYASARLHDERSEHLRVRRNELEPIFTEFDTGVMISVWHGGGLGYAATSDLSGSGLALAVERARHWAAITAGSMVTTTPPPDHAVGVYRSPVEVDWDTLPLEDRLELLHQQSRLLGIDDRIVDWKASLVKREVDTLLVTSGGGRIEQRFRFVYPGLSAVANEGTNTQSRTYGAGAFCGQGGAEVLGRHGFGDAASRIANEALELLDAPNCPSGEMDLLLAPDQMMLQIHESIGHPLELDRILGDERNYAGTSFVTADMFGSFQYGSELLNVTFDPTVPGQLASYGFDDDGTPATRQHLIENGILQARARRRRVAAAHRPRRGRQLAGIRLEPPADRPHGEPQRRAGRRRPLEELIGSIEHGVYLQTNHSWSIDDSRNKFQFGCEYGQRIEDGEIVGTVRNPGYRGISRTFWRNLRGVADADSFTVMGTPNCGKGELNQVVGTGHASPACLFADVDVFGGEE